MIINTKHCLKGRVLLKDRVVGKIALPSAGPSMAPNVCNHPEYEGLYTVTPKSYKQILQTDERVLRENIKVNSIPYAEVLNDSGGNTVTIG